ncbi:MAG: hypothetical protein A3D28_01205 [Omnitrophica bacterium RIFCSPHIGHO2_02_FULL_63_14]|nr:MAG: hypothetical protein A3D28_01205 [Omnitrophica bacterium RIFCSPHIGHO2_02_FULL_63_14]
MSVFSFLDQITEIKRNESLAAVYTLTGKEEFLEDHFESFPVMPGVLLLESLKQAALSLLVLSGDFEKHFYRLTEARDVRFGQFVRPPSRLAIEVKLLRKEGMANHFEGRIDLAGARALTASLVLEPVHWTSREKIEYFERLRGREQGYLE